MRVCLVWQSSVILQAGLGTDPFSTCMQGLQEAFQIPLAYGNTIIYLIMTGLAFLIDRKQIGVGTFLFPVISSYVIKLGVGWIPVYDGILCYITAGCGIIMMDFAIASSAKTSFGKNPYNAFIFALMKRFSRPYHQVRGLLDLGLLIIGIVLGGKAGIMTIVLLCVLGSLSMYCMQLLEQWTWLMRQIAYHRGGERKEY